MVKNIALVFCLFIMVNAILTAARMLNNTISPGKEKYLLKTIGVTILGQPHEEVVPIDKSSSDRSSSSASIPSSTNTDTKDADPKIAVPSIGVAPIIKELENQISFVLRQFTQLTRNKGR